LSQSNGFVEKFVFKRYVKKLTQKGGGTENKSILYCTTRNRNAQEGKSSAELMYGRNLRTTLNLFKLPSSQTPLKFVIGSQDRLRFLPFLDSEIFSFNLPTM